MKHNYRILIVDDIKNNRFVLEAFLKDFGRLEVAEHGREAFEAYQQSRLDQDPYDLILLDIMMPVMDGQTALKTIRLYETKEGIAEKDQVKVIMVSALGDYDNVLKSYKEGQAEEYIVKPVTKAKTIDAVEKALGLRKEE